MKHAHTRIPDYSVGATVLIIAIALPFFVFTRAAAAHRLTAQHSASPTAAPSVQPVVTPDPTATIQSLPGPGAPSPPLAAPSRSAQVAAHTAIKQTSQPSHPPSTSPPPIADSAPIAVLSVSPGSGKAPLVILADASASSDTDPTPITQVIFNFGDGTTVRAALGARAQHTFATPGTYTVSVLVIDSANLTSRASSTITVS